MVEPSRVVTSWPGRQFELEDRTIPRPSHFQTISGGCRDRRPRFVNTAWASSFHRAHRHLPTHMWLMANGESGCKLIVSYELPEGQEPDFGGAWQAPSNTAGRGLAAVMKRPSLLQPLHLKRQVFPRLAGLARLRMNAQRRWSRAKPHCTCMGCIGDWLHRVTGGCGRWGGRPLLFGPQLGRRLPVSSFFPDTFRAALEGALPGLPPRGIPALVTGGRRHHSGGEDPHSRWHCSWHAAGVRAVGEREFFSGVTRSAFRP